MRILGISAFYHDSAAALVVDGKVVAAAQEERFTRKKHDAGFPRHAIASCLEHAGIAMDQVDYVAFYDKPFLKFERLLETYLAFAPRGFPSFAKAIPVGVPHAPCRDRLTDAHRDAPFANSEGPLGHDRPTPDQADRDDGQPSLDRDHEGSLLEWVQRAVVATGPFGEEDHVEALFLDP